MFFKIILKKWKKRASRPNNQERTLGQSASLLLGLLVLPIARNSVWRVYFGVSWEALIPAHAVLGRLFLFALVCHAGCFHKAQKTGVFIKARFFIQVRTRVARLRGGKRQYLFPHTFFESGA